jgi:choline kinase
MANEIDTAIILAAGMGIRLRPFSEKRPKGFIEIDGITLIERSVRILSNHGIKRIILGTGYLDHLFIAFSKQHGLEVYHNEVFASSGSIYTLILSRIHLDSNFLLLESDLLYEPYAIEAILANDHENIILGSGFTYSGDEVYIEASPDQQLVGLSKDRDSLSQIHGELVGINKLSVSLLDQLTKWVHEDAVRRNFHYEDGLVEMRNRFSIHIQIEENLIWCEIDNEEHLNRATHEVYPQIISNLRGL